VKFRIDSNIGEVVTKLYNLQGKVTDAARSQMIRSADRIVENAKNYAPEDTGTLVESIKARRTYVNRRLSIEIVAGDGPPMPHPYGYNRMISAADYAALVHEAYWTFTKKPSEKTLAKIATYGSKVGEGFLRTAVEEEAERLHRNMIVSVEKVLLQENFL